MILTTPKSSWPAAKIPLSVMEQDIDRKDARLALVRDRYPKVWEIVNSDTPTSADVIEGMVAAIHRNPNGRARLW